MFEVPHRLLTFQLTRGVEVCVLCGPGPALAELEEEVNLTIMVVGVKHVVVYRRLQISYMLCLN